MHSTNPPQHALTHLSMHSTHPPQHALKTRWMVPLPALLLTCHHTVQTECTVHSASASASASAHMSAHTEDMIHTAIACPTAFTCHKTLKTRCIVKASVSLHFDKQAQYEAELTAGLQGADNTGTCKLSDHVSNKGYYTVQVGRTFTLSTMQNRQWHQSEGNFCL